MNYKEFRRQLGKAGLSGKEFASLVKINPNSLANYSKKGKVPSHWAIIASLMGEMAEHNIDFKSSLLSLDLNPNLPRGININTQPSSTKNNSDKE
jgi:23S rRNA maturation-related 3'-5' exoribonuclease YhaM